MARIREHNLALRFRTADAPGAYAVGHVYELDVPVWRGRVFQPPSDIVKPCRMSVGGAVHFADKRVIQATARLEAKGPVDPEFGRRPHEIYMACVTYQRAQYLSRPFYPLRFGKGIRKTLPKHEHVGLQRD